jgi:hypothetical protein
MTGTGVNGEALGIKEISALGIVGSISARRAGGGGGGGEQEQIGGDSDLQDSPRADAASIVVRSMRSARRWLLLRSSSSHPPLDSPGAPASPATASLLQIPATGNVLAVSAPGGAAGVVVNAASGFAAVQADGDAILASRRAAVRITAAGGGTAGRGTVRLDGTDGVFASSAAGPVTVSSGGAAGASVTCTKGPVTLSSAAGGIKLTSTDTARTGGGIIAVNGESGIVLETAAGIESRVTGGIALNAAGSASLRATNGPVSLLAEDSSSQGVSFASVAGASGVTISSAAGHVALRAPRGEVKIEAGGDAGVSVTGALGLASGVLTSTSTAGLRITTVAGGSIALDASSTAAGTITLKAGSAGGGVVVDTSTPLLAQGGLTVGSLHSNTTAELRGSACTGKEGHIQVQTVTAKHRVCVCIAAAYRCADLA